VDLEVKLKIRNKTGAEDPWIDYMLYEVIVKMMALAAPAGMHPSPHT
jgi:hypothetical protein